MTPDNPEIESQVPPAVEAPAVEAPAVEAPAVEAPAVEAPAVEAPAVEAPAVEAPAKPESRADRLAKEFGFDSAEAHGARVEEAREREAAKKR